MNMARWQRPQFPIWPGLGRLSDLRSEIDRLFEAPSSEWARTSQLLSGWTPALDVHEDKDSVVVEADLPGMKKEDIEICIQDGTLSISGERKFGAKREDAEMSREERFVGRFQRTVVLPTPVAADKVKAQYKNGVLTITLPKTEEAKPKQIQVQMS